MPHDGIDSVTVPGVVDGWSELHRRFGQRRWKEIFQPAIFYAEHGYPVPEVIQGYWQVGPEALAHDKESQRVYLPGGKVPAVGAIFRNPDLAKSLRMIADDGAKAFYRGKIARAIVSTSEAHGGTIAKDDLAEFSAEWVDPISTTYRGWTVYELPPNGQGMAALEMLNIMETTPASPDGPLSVRRIAQEDRSHEAGLRRSRALQRRSALRQSSGERACCRRSMRSNAPSSSLRDRAGDFAFGVPPGSDTTYLAVVDREGNIASLIQSNYIGFGSGITVRGMGFVLQSRGALFSLDPAHPNALAPRKRPFHTIIPAFMERGDQHIGFGIMGGANQPLAHAQFVSNVVDYGMNIQAALEHPRFTVGERVGRSILLETRVKLEVARQLSAMGHALEGVGDFSTAMGRGQAVLHDSRAKVNYGASDARADGAAAPEPPPVKW